MLKRKMEDKIRIFMEKQSKALLITGARRQVRHILQTVCKGYGKKSRGD